MKRRRMSLSDLPRVSRQQYRGRGPIRHTDGASPGRGARGPSRPSCRRSRPGSRSQGAPVGRMGLRPRHGARQGHRGRRRLAR